MMLGHMTNELAILRKLVLISDCHSLTSDIEKHSQAVQSMLLIKLFALKACAGSELIRKNNKQPFMKKYGRDPDGGLAETTRKLNRYFSGTSLLEYVRNKYTAHYDTSDIADIMKDWPDDTHFLYVGQQQGNTLYFAAEEMMFEALKSQAPVGPKDKNIMERLIDDVDMVAELLTDYAQGALIVIGKLYAKGDWNPNKLETEDITLVSVKDVSLPFFVDFTPELDE